MMRLCYDDGFEFVEKQDPVYCDGKLRGKYGWYPLLLIELVLVNADLASLGILPQIEGFPVIIGGWVALIRHAIDYLRLFSLSLMLGMECVVELVWNLLLLVIASLNLVFMDENTRHYIKNVSFICNWILVLLFLKNWVI